MGKQKICIVGGGLTGLITAATLGKLNLKIDLVTGNLGQDFKSDRTIAISQNNLNYLKRLNIFKFKKNEFWPCLEMKLYKQDQKKITKIFEFNNNKKQVLYMIKNSNIIKNLIQSIKKNKSISFKTNQKISNIISSGLLKVIKFKNKSSVKYNLIIICTGNDSNLVKNIFTEKVFKHSYEEISGTTILKHKPLQNNIVRQIFFHNEILALLPISNTKTSIVWSVNKNLMKKYKSKSNLLFKKKIKFYTKTYLKKIRFFNNIEYKNLNFLIRKIYYKNRVLLFGDALHVVHPFVGQGFNMTLRDLAALEKSLKAKINLGLDIGSLDVLSEFTDERKSANLIHSLGINFIKEVFSVKKKSLKNLRNVFITRLNNNNFLKEIFFNFADKGFKF
jgi:2-octaprenyl-6-methoxyphenol hydroxylase